jgi:hypothetical protein
MGAMGWVIDLLIGLVAKLWTLRVWPKYALAIQMD